MISTSTLSANSKANNVDINKPVASFGSVNPSGAIFCSYLRLYSNEDEARITTTNNTSRNLGENNSNTEFFYKAATLSEVATNNYVLSPGLNMGSEAEEDDGVPFEEKMQLLTSELAAQFEEIALLEKRIRENLEGIGVELYNRLS